MTNEQGFSEFVELLNYDINFLIGMINERYPKFIQFIKKNEINISSAKIDFSLFQKLIVDHCYKNIEHVIKNPIIEEGQINRDIPFFNVPADRLLLFKKIFIKDLISIGYSPSKNAIATSGISSLNLYYTLFHILFHEKFFKRIDVQNSLEKVLLEWNDMVNNQRIKITCELNYSGISISENYTLSQRYHIIKENGIMISSLDPFVYYPKDGITKIVINQQMPVVFTMKRRKRLENKKAWQMASKATILYERAEEEFRKILVALFLEGVKIPMIIPQYKFPWWINQNKINFQDKKISSYLFPEKKISKDNYEKSLNNYELFISKDFFDDKYYPLCNNLFRLAVETREFADWLFDLHIILEYLFAPGSEGELSFRIALNASHFISEDIDEFKNNFYFFRNIYSLRSTAIHGGDWKKFFPKLLNKLKRFNISIDSLQDLKKVMESKIIKIILNLIDQELTIPLFKKKIEENPLFFIENSRVFKRD